MSVHPLDQHSNARLPLPHLCRYRGLWCFKGPRFGGLSGASWAVHVPWPKRGAGKPPAGSPSDPPRLLLLKGFSGEAEAAVTADVARLWVAIHEKGGWRFL